MAECILLLHKIRDEHVKMYIIMVNILLGFEEETVKYIFSFFFSKTIQTPWSKKCVQWTLMPSLPLHVTVAYLNTYTNMYTDHKSHGCVFIKFHKPSLVNTQILNPWPVTMWPWPKNQLESSSSQG